MVAIFVLLVWLSTFLQESQPEPQFTFARLEYTGYHGTESIKNWYTDYPAMDGHVVTLLNRLTRIRASSARVKPSDPELFQYPFIYVVEPEQMNLSDEDVLRLREYLARGGVLWLDDFHGDYEFAGTMNTLERILPGVEPLELWREHELFHCFYDIPKVERVVNDQLALCGDCEKWENGPSGEIPKVFATFNDAGDIIVLMTWNSDTGDGIEWLTDPRYPLEMGIYATRLVVNIAIYTLTH